MNKCFLYIAILILNQLPVIAQEKGIDNPLVTGFGKDVGFKTERTITSDGGRIVSFDGKLELIIPAGALK